MLHPTIDKLRRLRLIGMAKALEEQLAQPDSERLSFDERLGILVDREEVDRQNAALAQRLRLARLRQAACLEDIDYRTARGLDRALIRTLSSRQWLQQHNNILILRPTGIGKSWIACALGNRPPATAFGAVPAAAAAARRTRDGMSQRQVRPPAGADREDPVAHSR